MACHAARNLFATKRGAGGGIVKFAAGSNTPTAVFTSVTSDLSAIVIDSHDNLFVADYQAGIVYKRPPAGPLSVFKSGYTNPFSLAIDPQDNVYVGELLTQDVYKLTPGGGAGVRYPSLPQPILDFALGPFDIFYTAGYHLNQIGQMSLGGSMIAYAGSGAAGLLNGTLPLSRFNSPSGIAIDPVTGYIYVADWNSDAVRVIRDDTGPTEGKRTSWGRVKALYR